MNQYRARYHHLQIVREHLPKGTGFTREYIEQRMKEVQIEIKDLECILHRKLLMTSPHYMANQIVRDKILNR